jgi:NAD(P)-dependent dehydrogenase (short-subunit alcohol dehydrogenase family)
MCFTVAGRTPWTRPPKRTQESFRSTSTSTIPKPFAAWLPATEAELDGLYNVHFKGVFFLTQKLLPLINDRGRIVNLSSGLTRIVVPESGAYASMKGQLRF